MNNQLYVWLGVIATFVYRIDTETGYSATMRWHEGILEVSVVEMSEEGVATDDDLVVYRSIDTILIDEDHKILPEFKNLADDLKHLFEQSSAGSSDDEDENENENEEYF